MTRIPGYQRHLYPNDWDEIAKRIKAKAHWCCEACGVSNGPAPFVLTVHHIDFNPQNNEDDNLIALCQRCHLKIQARIPQPRTRLEVIQRLRQQGRQYRLRF